MTGNSDKLRALVLSALMVLSVFAGTVALSGTAAAAENPQPNEFTNTTVEENSQVSHTINFTVDNVYAAGGNETFNVTLPAVGSFDGTPTVNVQDEAGNSVDVYNVDATNGASNNALEFETNTTSQTNLTVEIDATVNWGSVGSDTTANATLSVNDDNSLSETPVQSLTIEAVDGLTEGKSVFQGQTVQYTGNDVGNNNDVSLETSEGSLVTQLQSNAVGAVTIDTGTVDLGDALDAGSYRLVNSTGDVVVNFKVTEQRLVSSIDTETVTTDGDATEATLEFNSNRNNYATTISVLNSDGDLASLPNDAAQKTRSGGDNSVTFNFSGADTGDYTIVAEVDDTTASTSKSVTVRSIGNAQVDLVSSTVRENQGDIAEVNVSMTNTDTAFISIGGPDAGYQFNATVRDTDEDGYTVVKLNTYTAGANRGGILAGAESGSVTKDYESNLPGIIAQGDYEIGIDRESLTQAGEDPDNVGTLFVRPRSTDSMQLWRTATDYSSITSEEVIADGIESGTVAQDDTFNAGDVIVHQVSVSGIGGLLAGTGETGATDQFVSAVNNSDLALTMVQDEDTTRQNRAPKELNLTEAVNNNDVRVIAGADDTYYIVVDADTKSFQRGGTGGFVTAASGDAFEVTFTVSEDSDIASSDESVGASFSVSTASVSFSQDTFNLESGSGQEITGTSTLAPGSTVTVRVESEDPNNPFVDRQEATVGSDGSFSAEFDLSSLPQGTNLSITLADRSASADGRIASAASFEVSDLSAPSTAQIGDTATVTATVTNTGDLEGSTPVEFSIAGMTLDSVTQNVTLAGGESTTVEFNIPVTDELTPGQTYTHGVSAGDGEETAEITIEEQSTPTPTTAEPTTAEPTTAEPTTAEPTTAEPTTAEPTTAEPTTAEPTTAEPTTAEPTGTETMGDDGTTTEESGGGQPGFTMGVGIVALLAAALLALRRRN